MLASHMSPTLKTAKEVIAREAEGLSALETSLGPEFEKAIEIIKSCSGRVIFSGMGKSGHIAAKVAATMASTGTPAFAIHPGEASHGDLGMVSPDDVLILISNSGNSAELRDLIAHARRQDLPVIGISKNSDSLVGRAAHAFLALPHVEEACALRLAPTTSTTMTLALGDALCVALMEEKGFEPADFHRFHPGGKLGLDLMQVRELMRPAQEVPQCPVSAPMDEVLATMNAGKLGLIALMDQGKVSGVITDGDIRRNSHEPLIAQDPRAIMSSDPIWVYADDLAPAALKTMNDRSVTALIVREANQEFVGLLHIHELLRSGLA